jgi:predicted nucleic acid-binding protein
MCALKRPFDDQTQSRILIETAAVNRVLDATTNGLLTLCNSAASVAENRRNPNKQRRERVDALLAWVGMPASATKQVFAQAEELTEQAFRDMDALHLAFAEESKADYFVTVDDDVLAQSRRTSLNVKVVDVIELVKELKL